MAAEAIQVAVRVEDGIPKLLVKISPSTCAGFAAKNLGEVTVKRPGAPRGHVAVLHLSSAVPAGSVLISLKLSELLEVTSGDQVQIVHSDRVRRAARREPPQDPMVMRRGSWSDLPVPGQRVQAVQQNWREPLGGNCRSFGRPLQEPAFRFLDAEPVPQAADELGTETPGPIEFSPLPKAIPRTSIQSPNQQKLSQKASNLGFATPSLPVTCIHAGFETSPSTKVPASAPCTPQRCLMPAFAQAAHSQRGEPPKPGYAPMAQPQVVHPQMSQQQPFNPATRTVFKAPAHFVQPGSPGSASRTLNAANPASVAFSRPMASTAPAPGRRPGTEACKEALGQVEVADWLPASMGSPVWKAAQQPPPSSAPALVPKAPSTSPTRTHSPSPSPPQMRPEGAQPKMPSPKFQPFPQPQSSPQGPLLRDGERAVRVRQSVPNLQPRRVHSQAELQRGTGRRGTEIKMSPSPKVAPERERQSLSPPPLRMPRAAPSPTSASGEPSSPSLGPFHAPPGPTGPNLQEPEMPEKAAAAHARNGGVSWRNGTSAQGSSLTKETAADRSLSPAQPAVKPVVGPAEETSSPKADCSEQQPPPLVQRRDKLRPTALVHLPGAARSVSAKPRRTGTVRRPASQGLGHLQCEPCPACTQPAAAPSVSCDWRRPQSTGGGSLERSELGPEITSEVRRWLLGLTEGLQCSHVVMDKALTVLSNFKLSSGCELEVLGGPLGAIVGGYNEADWLHQEMFSKSPADAVKESFELLGFGDVREGDWSGVMVEEVSLAYRRQCLRGHPSRGGPARGYLKLQVAMEVIRAFCGEAGPLTPEPAEEISSAPFVLDDLALARELELTPSQAAQEADSLPVQRLEELNRALDEYILRQMCFKSEIVAEIARLHENSAYSILGVSPDASDAEIKKAYRVVAMQCHPDKGGDKAEFQELHEAYEKIMEQRRSSANLDGKSRKQRETDSDDDPDSEEKEEQKEETEEREEKPEENHQEKKEASSERAEAEESEEDGSDAQLLAKAAKAADEASRYAKTAAEFAHQAAEAAETARQGRDSGGAITLTKSIAHSAIVLTLTVVKAVRVVGYATMDVAAQCRLASRKFTEASCAESSTEAMGLGLEALNAALACAEVTETTAAELQAPEGLEASEAAERFVNAAVRASLAAASASNAAMSAAIAAVEGHRQCMQAVEAKKETAEEGPEPAEADKDDASEGKDQSQPSDHGSDDESVSPPEPRRHSKEDSAQAAIRRQVTQRNNNHKVLQRLNAEILTHQQNVREFLQANRQLIPAVSTEAKRRVHTLLSNYAREVGTELQERVQADPGDLAEVLQSALKSTGLLAPFLQKQTLAIPICPKARVLKMAALYDLRMTVQVLEQEIFRPVQSLLEQADKSPSYAPLAEIQEKVQKELVRCIEEEHDGA
ncbi:DJA6 [Symbiodinium microadriaticum]|nr:DJA6 [Symbiodinium microadriaticum]